MGTTRFDGPWTALEAAVLIRELAGLLEKSGYSLGLTGSVLKHGKSTHDLDLIVYPLQDTVTTDFEVARRVLREYGMELRLTSSQLHDSWRRKGSKDEKPVEVWSFGGRRIDFFFLGARR